MEKLMSMQKKGLGRGLSALIPVAAEPRTEPKQENFHFEVAVDRIVPSPLQPRRAFDETKIEELASSIRNQGIIQPLVVRPNGVQFELIAGERRWRAAMKAGLSRVPVVVRNATDHEALQLALVENLQREDLNPIEEANGYRRLQEEFHWSQEEMAAKVGKSRPAIANAMRLLALPAVVQQEVVLGNLPAGQARALLGLHTEPLIVSACREVIAKGLSTRETEKMVRHLLFGRRRRRFAPLIDPDLKSIVEELQRLLGTRVRLLPKARSAKGKVEIEYYSQADLGRIFETITRSPARS
ncbi:MAG: ParB/RepB/Spo0J family partition protein [Deltaproteobacteria bacterium]|nr:ParB/RepB/Spo0J family partition protein [Deltaproteobacteria bacterium]MBI2534458.1 ParB/RepB/Spo0J family partition protein [Deltaproteobacteria bacterium]